MNMLFSTKSLFDTRFHYSKLSTRLIKLVLIYATLFSILVTILEIFVEYKRDMAEIDEQFEKIDRAYSASLAISLWIAVDRIVDSHLNVLIELPFVSYVKISTPPEFPDFERGEHQSVRMLEKKIDLIHQHYRTLEPQHVGILTIQVDMRRVYNSLFQKMLLIVLYQVAKNLILAMLLIYFFSKVATVHLEKIVRYLDSTQIVSSDKTISDRSFTQTGNSAGTLTLDRAYINDELQYLAEAINKYNSRTMDFLEELRDKESKLENEMADNRRFSDALQVSLNSVAEQRRTVATQLQSLNEALQSAGQFMISYDADQQITYSNLDASLPKEISDAISLPLVSCEQAEEHFLREGFTICANHSEKILNFSDSNIYSLEIESPYHQIWQISAFNLKEGGISFLCADVSKFRNLEKSVRQSQKMDAIGLLASGIAHDVNNILAIIQSNLELIEFDYEKLPRSTIERIGTALDAANRCGIVVSSILSFSHSANTTNDSINVRAQLDDLIPLLKGTLPPQIDLKIESSSISSNCYVSSPSGVLETAIVNLVVNARDAIEHNGTIELILRKADPEELTSVAMGQISEGIIIEVIDDGTGVPEVLRERIFDPFFTTKKINEGTGLGLAQVFRFARDSGGNLRHLNRLPRGTIMQIILPCFSAAVPNNYEVNKPDTKMEQSEARVLIVDDEKFLLETICAYLHKLQMEVVTSASVSDVERMLEHTSAQDFDIVITDFHLADGTGLDILKLFSQNEVQIPVILMSGDLSRALDGDEEARKFFKLLNKPFKLKELTRLINQCLN